MIPRLTVPNTIPVTSGGGILGPHLNGDLANRATTQLPPEAIFLDVAMGEINPKRKSKCA